MTQAIFPPRDLSDHDLLVHVQQAARDERYAMAHLIALLMELDARKLYLAQGCASLFTFCMQVLHLSEHAAYGRIEAARAARRFPVILDGLVDGTLNLTTVTLRGAVASAARRADTGAEIARTEDPVGSVSTNDRRDRSL